MCVHMCVCVCVCVCVCMCVCVCTFMCVCVYVYVCVSTTGWFECTILPPGGGATVRLYSQQPPFSPQARLEFDRTLGGFNSFALAGHYIFAEVCIHSRHNNWGEGRGGELVRAKLCLGV